MQFVKENTQIPVPKVYGYDFTYRDALGTSYIFIEYIAGKPCSFPFSGQRPVKDDDLLKTHTQLTTFAWQLLKHPFDKIGQLRFATGEERGVVIGPIIDRKERLYGPFTSSRTFYKERAKTVYEFETRRHLSREDFTVEDSLESAALHVLAAEHAGKECFDSGPFIIQHADMHWQNLLFDEQCMIVGVIDWEWTQTVPVDSFSLLPYNFAKKNVTISSRKRHPTSAEFTPTVQGSFRHGKHNYRTSYCGGHDFLPGVAASMYCSIHGRVQLARSSEKAFQPLERNNFENEQQLSVAVMGQRKRRCVYGQWPSTSILLEK